MEGVSNGGMLYHEVQESKLCAVHCVNTVLQGPFFSEFDLAALASDLDTRERQVMLSPGAASAADPASAVSGVASSGDFLSEESHNVSLDGDFSIQVLEKALEVWDLHVIPFHSPAAGPAQVDPELESAFICHLHDHWFCIRKVNGEWYNFDSLYAGPTYLSKFYLSAYVDTLRGSGWSIFLVKGNFPRECPVETSHAYGQWLSPEDAHRITNPPPPQNPPSNQPTPSSNQAAYDLSFMTGMLSQFEDHELNAAIAASLKESSPSIRAGSESSGTSAAMGKELTEEDLRAAIAATMTQSSSPASREEPTEERK